MINAILRALAPMGRWPFVGRLLFRPLLGAVVDSLIRRELARMTPEQARRAVAAAIAQLEKTP